MLFVRWALVYDRSLPVYWFCVIGGSLELALEFTLEAGKGGCIQRMVTGYLRSGSVVWSVYLGCGAKPVC